MLTTKEMYQHIVELTVAPDSTIKDRGTGEACSLTTKMIDNIEARITAVRNVLITMPEFKDFLIKHGNQAFQMILDEFVATKEKYKVKSIKKKHYSDLYYSINPENIRAEFEKLFADTCQSCKTFDINPDSGSIILDEYVGAKKSM